MPTSFTDLPPEMVELIFSFVDNKKDRRSLTLVSKSCYNIIRQQSTSRQVFKPWPRIRGHNVLKIFISVDRFPFHAVHLITEEIEENREFWKRHGATITEFTFDSDRCPYWTKGWKQSTLIDMMELFPNLQKITFDKCKNPLEGIENITQKFGIGVKEVTVTVSPNYPRWNAFLSLFPGLKRAHLHFTNMGSPPNLDEFREFLDFWSTRLDELELNITLWDMPKLFKAFEEWNNEKLTFGHVQLALQRENMKSIKWFFSHPRHIKRLEAFGPCVFQDKPLFDFINRYATIERLDDFYSNIGRDSIPNVLLNINGVKEICLHMTYPPANNNEFEAFTPEALLKVTEFTDFGAKTSWNYADFVNLPRFQNLRKLVLNRSAIHDNEVDFMVENFPNLEEIYIHDFLGSGGTLFSPLRKLKKIVLNDAESLTDESLIVGFDLPNLKSLEIRDTKNVTPTGVLGLLANCPNIEKFYIDGDQIDDACIGYMKENFCQPEPR